MLTKKAHPKGDVVSAPAGKLKPTDKRFMLRPHGGNDSKREQGD